MNISMWITCTLSGISNNGSSTLFHLQIEIKDIQSKCKPFVSIESYIPQDDPASNLASTGTSMQFHPASRQYLMKLETAQDSIV